MSELVSSESFDVEKTYEYILSIQVSLDGFSFSIHSQQQNILALKSTQLKISNTVLISRRFNDWLESEELIKRPFKKIRVFVFSNKFTLIPEKYYLDTLKQKVASLLFEENSELEIAENVISKLSTRLIFALPTGLNNVIAEQIGECEIVHPIKTILNSLPKTFKENGLVLLFDVKDFYIVLFRKDKVLLINNFKMTHVNDVVYYILTTLKQLEIPTSKTSLHITDSINKLPEIENSLKTYFNEIEKLELIPFKLELA
ncbi:MAG: DUF3822 family protein [Draconibacterium sp.]|nr:DUF3822 family protein [Draconibacterium sp.]